MYDIKRIHVDPLLRVAMCMAAKLALLKYRTWLCASATDQGGDCV